MKRLLIVNPTLRVGGVERKIADIADYLARHPRENTRVDLILEESPPTDSSQAIFFKSVQQSPVHIHFNSLRAIPFFLYLLCQFARLKPDIVLAFSRRPSVLALTLREILRWRRFRLVLGNDSIASQDLGLYVRHPLVQRILKTHMQMLYPRADLILAPSEISKRDLITHFYVAPEKIRVLKNWTPQIESAELPKKFDLVYVGRVDKVKQLARLVQIAAQVRQAFPQLRVVIVGNGTEMENVRRATREHGLEKNIEFVGFQANVGTWLAQSKIFCLTSQFEGLPIAALEAMAYGLPIVTFAYDGAEELVQHGETGLLCANEQEFSEALVTLLADDELRERMGNRAREFVQHEHGEHVLAQYVDLIFESR